MGHACLKREGNRGAFPLTSSGILRGGQRTALRPAVFAPGRAGVQRVGRNAVPVAEFTVAQIVLANKGFFQSAAIMKSAGRGAARSRAEGFPGNLGAKVGLIGCGMIGSLVAQMLQPYRLEVLAYDPYLSDAAAFEFRAAKRNLRACRLPLQP